MLFAKKRQTIKVCLFYFVEKSGRISNFFKSDLELLNKKITSKFL